MRCYWRPASALRSRPASSAGAFRSGGGPSRTWFGCGHIEISSRRRSALGNYADEEEIPEVIVGRLPVPVMSIALRQPKTGATVDLAIIVGPGGPISVHTPEICYSSRAYSIEEPRRRMQLSDGDGHKHSFWNTDFQLDERDRRAASRLLRLVRRRNMDRVGFSSLSVRWASLVVQATDVIAGSAREDENVQDPCQEFLSAFLQSGWNVCG